jgi:hypothetical protein
MKEIRNIFIICMLLSGLVQCSGKKESSWWEPAQQTRPNAYIGKKQIDMVRIGDSEVKASALLGQPTVRKSTQNGTELIWYLIATEFQEDAYETLKRPPKQIEGHKFIRLFVDTAGKITEREFEL